MDRSSLSSSTRSRPSNVLGKRGASEAGMDGKRQNTLVIFHRTDTTTRTDPHVILRSLQETETKYTTLKRQFVALQGQDIQQKDEIRDLRGDLEVLRQQRSTLVDGSKESDSLAEKNEKAWEEERVSGCLRLRLRLPPSCDWLGSGAKG